MLRGLGVTLALPWLEAMGPMNAWADEKPAGKAPNRMAFLYVPNGQNMADWTPKTEGADFALPAILEPLKDVKDDFSILTGLAASNAWALGDGGGDHARALAAFLTGAHPRKTEGADIRVGISVDQVAASRIGDDVRLPSLEIGCEQSTMAGGCDSGYSCVYSSVMSWKSATQPLPKEINPKLVFERLFTTGGDGSRAQENARRRSLLDLVREDAADLSGKLGVGDKRKLDEYVTSVRDIEQRMERAEKLPPVKTPDFPKPEGIPKDYQEHIRLMCDLMVLAFQADVTRVCTYMFANEGSNHTFPSIGVNEGHHELPRITANRSEEEGEDSGHQHFSIEATGVSVEEAERHQGRRRHAAGPLHDRVRKRELRRQRPQPRRPAAAAGGEGLRDDQDGAAYPVCEEHAAEQSLAFDAGPDEHRCEETGG